MCSKLPLEVTLGYGNIYYILHGCISVFDLFVCLTCTRISTRCVNTKTFSHSTVHFTGLGFEYRLQQFDLTIYNTSNNEVLCAYQHDIIETSKTITCSKPITGRYVHFKRKGGIEINITGLCEVVIIGHKVYGKQE